MTFSNQRKVAEIQEMNFFISLQSQAKNFNSPNQMHRFFILFYFFSNDRFESLETHQDNELNSMWVFAIHRQVICLFSLTKKIDIKKMSLRNGRDLLYFFLNVIRILWKTI